MVLVSRSDLAISSWRLSGVRSRRGVRTALVSVARANGQTMLAAALAVAELSVGPASAEVLVVASD